MDNFDKTQIPPDDQFKTISEFKWCVDCGGEVEFEWNGKLYSITHPDGVINVGEGYYLKDGKAYNVFSNEQYDTDKVLLCSTAEEALEYQLGDVRLRDVITQIKIIDRTL